MEGISTDIEYLTANLTNNGYYEYIENQQGDQQLTLIENYQEGQDYDVRVNVSQTTNPLETLTDKELTQDNLVNGKIPVSNLMNNSQNYAGITKNSTLIPKLTTVTNKRLTSSTVTVSNIINDNTSLGLSGNSTLILDPPVNYGFCNIEQNGQYSPNQFNSSGEYDPTHSAGWDYIDQINVNVYRKININNLYYAWVNDPDGDHPENLTKLNFVTMTNPYPINGQKSYITLTNSFNNVYENCFVGWIKPSDQSSSYSNLLNWQYISQGITAPADAYYFYLYNDNNGNKELIFMYRYIFTGGTWDFVFINLYNTLFYINN